ncbi:hypothetical protein EGW08_008404, partial [Elysia chlorotica]
MHTVRNLYVPLLFFCLHVFISRCFCNVHSIFHHFDILKSKDISVKDGESTNTEPTKHIRLSFTAFQTRFTLVLRQGGNVLHPHAEATVVDGLGKMTPVPIDRSVFFSGTANRNPSFEVNAASLRSVWIIHIDTPNEFYAVEPLKFYDSEANSAHMIVYRGRDIRTDNQTQGQSFCGEFSLNRSLNVFPGGEHKTTEKKVGKTIRYKNKSQETPHFKHMFSHVSHTFQNDLSKSTPRIFQNDAKSNRRESFDPLNLKYLLLKHTLHESKKQNSEMKSTFKSERKRVPHPLPSKHTRAVKRDKRSDAKFDQRKHLRPRNCDTLVIVDHTLYQGIGAKSEANIIITLTHVYTMVDKIFRRTSFGNRDGYGIVLRGIRIHREPSAVGYNAPHDGNKDPNALLYKMVTDVSLIKYCMAILHVQRDFSYTLGISPVPNSKRAFKYGICGSANPGSSHNVILTTAQNVGGEILSLKMFGLAIAHEIGHNWGSHHDPVSGPCAGSSQNGHFIMWPTASSSPLKRNNYEFSRCSRGQIGDILKHRAKLCFRTDQDLEQLCGNGILEPSEECDPGPYEGTTGDPCCTASCGFRLGAVCSPRNQPCCTSDCQIANMTQTCNPRGVLMPCYKQSNCTGDSASFCPLSESLPNSTPCGDKGECWYGRCESFCEILGRNMTPPLDLRPCQKAENKTTMCLHCCRKSGSEVCNCPSGVSTLKDGSPCISGICSKGKCVPGKKQYATRGLMIEKLFNSAAHAREELARTI